MTRSFCSIRTTMQAAALSAVFATLAACGGGGSDEAAPVTPSNPQAPTQTNPDPVVGVQTPDSVSVVTATNAG